MAVSWPLHKGPRASEPRITYDSQKGLRCGRTERASSQRGLTDVHPGVGGRRVADGEASPMAVEPPGDLHPVPLPGHVQLLDRPGRAQGMIDNNGESRRWQES